MLEQILDYIHNYFEQEVHTGKFEIKDGQLPIELQDGQYYKIVGSIFNDGVHQYPTSYLFDETFCGEVWAMAVPPRVIALAAEIEEWNAKYSDVMNSPFTSESFGGYSYTKGSGGEGSNNNAADWRGVFGSRLNHWRKIA